MFVYEAIPFETWISLWKQMATISGNEELFNAWMNQQFSSK